MGNIIQFVGPDNTVVLFGVRLVGVNFDTGKKLLFSIVFVLGVYLLGKLLRTALSAKTWNKKTKKIRFWTRQGISITLAVIMVVGLVSLWFDKPATLAGAAGMVTAGLAFALQRVVTSFAGYIVILRGNTFSVGDRIRMAGIRGDVISVKFLQTVIMEMGQPGDESDDNSWVHARQYTGRLVHVSNANIFDKPVYNYSHEFPYIWEEMHLPVPYNADRNKAEQILLDTARKHTADVAKMSEDMLRDLEKRYVMSRSELVPQVFWTLTDNWLEMSLRFIVPTSGIRQIKSDMSRDIIAALDQAGIGIASGTYEVVGMPPLKIQVLPTPQDQAGSASAS